MVADTSSDFSSQFDEKFTKTFLAFCLRDSEFLAFLKGQATPELFVSEVSQRLIRIINDFYSSERAAPGDLISHVIDDYKRKGVLGEAQHTTLLAFVNDLKAIKLQNREYIKKEFNRYAKERMFKKNILPAANFVNQGKFEDAERLMREVFAFSTNQQIEKGVYYTADASERIEKRERADTEAFWFLIPELDSRLQGCQRKEVWLAQSSRSSGGKSALLVHLCRSYLFQKRRVLVLSLEMSEDAYLSRLDMCCAGLTKDLLTNRQLIEMKLQKIMKHGVSIHVKKFSPGTYVERMLDYADRLAATDGFIPDCVIIDYMDLLGTPGGEKWNSYVVGKKCSEQLCAWANDRNVLVWSACQSNRAGASALLLSQEHISDSLAKVYAADGILGINRSPEEQKTGMARIAVLKNRDGPAGAVVSIHQKFEKMCFYVSGERE